jgi:hypothetical protein
VNGLDEVDVRRHIAAAISDLLDELEDRQNQRRRDAARPCCDRRATTDALREARRLITALGALAASVGRVAGDPHGRVTRCLGGHEELCTSLGQVLETITDDAELGCTHECPTIPRTLGDTAAVASDLVDRLEARGYQLARIQQRWAS